MTSRLQRLRELGPSNLPNRRKVVGLTGNPGSGKTTAAHYFKSRGARLIHGDQIGHELLNHDKELQRTLVDRFGRSILRADGTVDRTALGRIVFADADVLNWYNRLVHAALISRIEQQVRQFRESEELGPLIVDAALIFEWAIEDLFDGVIVITSPMAVRKQRFMNARNTDAALFDRIEASQLPEKEKIEKADVVIENHKSLEHFYTQLNQFLEE